MTSQESTVCLKCGGMMEPGYTTAVGLIGGDKVDSQQAQLVLVIAGTPTSRNPIKAFNQGTADQPANRQFRIVGARCSRCGLLEFYGKQRSNKQWRPRTTSRVLALLVGAMYLAILSVVFAAVTSLPIIVTGLLVLSGAFAIVAVFAVLASRLVRNEQSTKRFGLSSILLLFVPLSIYLAALRVLFGPLSAEGLPMAAWIQIAVFAFVMVAMSTVILVWMGEAVIWIAVQIQRNGSARGKLFRDGDL